MRAVANSNLAAGTTRTLRDISDAICRDGNESWKLWMFEFVDAFRQSRSTALIKEPPVEQLDERIRCLLASTTESLCHEIGLVPPAWCAAVKPLPQPWFVAGVENLKASALVEASPHFRRRNIFVLGNFLDRA